VEGLVPARIERGASEREIDSLPLADNLIEAKSVAVKVYAARLGVGIVIAPVRSTGHVRAGIVSNQTSAPSGSSRRGRNPVARERLAAEASRRRRSNRGGVVDLILLTQRQQLGKIALPLPGCGYRVESLFRTDSVQYVYAVSPEGAIATIVKLSVTTPDR
jgi:hypothetical protein